MFQLTTHCQMNERAREREREREREKVSGSSRLLSFLSHFDNNDSRGFQLNSGELVSELNTHWPRILRRLLILSLLDNDDDDDDDGLGLTATANCTHIEVRTTAADLQLNQLTTFIFFYFQWNNTSAQVSRTQANKQQNKLSRICPATDHNGLVNYYLLIFGSFYNKFWMKTAVD